MLNNPKLALALLARQVPEDNSGIHLQLAKLAMAPPLPRLEDWDQAFVEFDKTLVGVKHIGIVKR